MTFLWILLGIILFFLLLFMLKTTVILDAGNSGKGSVSLTLKVLFFKIPLYPSKKQNRKSRRKTVPGKSPSTVSSQKDTESKGLLSKIKLIRRLVHTFSRHFWGYLKLRVTEIQITVGSQDAAKTAILFGVINQAVLFLLEILDNMRKIKHGYSESVHVQPDFSAERSTYRIRLEFSLRIWQLVSIGFKSLKMLFHEKK